MEVENVVQAIKEEEPLEIDDYHLFEESVVVEEEGSEESDEIVKCESCSEVYKSLEELNQHCLDKHSSQTEKIRTCSKVFAYKTLLDSHLITDQTCFQCEICPKIYSTKYSLRCHMKKRHPLECKHCEETFESKKLLVEHASEKHAILDSNPTRVQCQKCSKFYANRESLMVHMRITHNLKCKQCGEMFTSKELLNQHYSESHSARAKFYGSENSLRGHMRKEHRLECEHCKETFSLGKQLVQHASDKHQSQVKKCHLCNESLENQTVFEKHMESEHEFVKCKECCTFFTNQNTLKYHMFQHHQFSCDHCPRAFQSKIKYDKHLIEEHNGENFQVAKKPKLSLDQNLTSDDSAKDNHSEKSLKEHSSEEHKMEEKNSKAVQCKVCLKSYACGVSLANHMRSSHSLKCDHCGYMFATKGKLDKHYKEAHPKQGRKCTICEEFFENQDQFVDHMYTQHGHIQCKECGIFTPNKNSLNVHIHRYHRLKCDYCTKSFLFIRELETHLMKEHAELTPNQVFKSYDSETETNDEVDKCRKCDKMFKNRTLLVSHLITQHKYFPCELCSKLYATKDSLRAHLRQLHIYKCEHCERTFELKKRLIQHCAKKHGIEEENPNSVQCQVCSKFYASKASLAVHMRATHPLRCELCGKICTTKNLLTQHYSEVHPNRKRQCRLCEENFENQTLLESHMKSEHKSVHCKVCDVLVVNKAALKSHMYRNHRIKCDHCPKTLHLKKEYYEHLKEKHSIDIYICDHCELTFTSQASLKEHIVEKHNEEAPNVMQVNEDQLERSEDDDMIVDSIEIEKYTCDQCCASFDAFHELEYHKKEHITRIDHLNDISVQTEIFKGEIYQCNICNERFGSIDDLEKHSKNHIKKELDL